MADVYGKLDFSWVQRCKPCILNPTNISAISNWQLAISQTNIKTKALRGRSSNGGRP